MAYFGEFWGAKKIKVFLYRDSWAPLMAFGSILWQMLDFRAKQRIKDIIKCCYWIGRGRLKLVCYIRTYIIILQMIFPLTSPNQNIGGCVTSISMQRGWRQLLHIVASNRCATPWPLAMRLAKKTHYCVISLLHVTLFIVIATSYNWSKSSRGRSTVMHSITD